MKILYPQKH